MFLAVMAEVSCRLGAGLRPLSSLQTHAVFCVTACRPVGSDNGTTGLEDEEKGSELVPHWTGVGSLVLNSGKVVIRQLIPGRPANGSYRMVCWINRSVLPVPGTIRTQKSDFHKAYFPVFLLSDRRTRHRPRVTITQTCSCSNNDQQHSSLHQSRTAYYDILQVSPSATQAQIKTAYYKQSFLYHPDKNAGSEEATNRFTQISEAYSILGSTGLRKKYDRGILSPADVLRAGRPSGKESSARSSGPQQQRSRPLSNITVGGKTMFDFDKFYQAHYGEQLKREQELRSWRKLYEEKQKKHYRKWKQGTMTDVAVGFLFAVGCAVFFSIRS